MLKKVLNAGVAAAITLTGFTALPASAQDYRYDRAGYGDYDRGDYEDGYRDQRDAYERGYERRRHYYRETRHRGRRCSSGTTGAIIGGVLGGLLGREIGRGGYYNEPSTTGLIIGAGGGALAGRAIERNRNCR